MLSAKWLAMSLLAHQFCAPPTKSGHLVLETKMSISGIAGGLLQTVDGILEEKPGRALMGVVKTAAGVGGLILSHIHENAGSALSDYSESDD